MKITIVGNGNMAKGLAARFLAGGHTVEIHARNMARGEAIRDELVKGSGGDLTVAEIGGDVGDILVPAVHYGAEMAEVANQYADATREKIVVDITNPVDFKTFQLIPAPGTSGAEVVAALFPSAKLVKAFNMTFAAALLTGKAGGLPLDVFIAGDDDDAKKTIAGLVEDGEMRPLDVGPLANAHHLEGFGLIHMSLQDQVQGNWASGVKIVT